MNTTVVDIASSQLWELVVGPDASRLEWLQARRSGVGASDTAKVMGRSKWGSPLSVWLDKTSTEPVRDVPPSEAALWGHLLEPVIAAEFARRNDLHIAQMGLLRSIQYPHLLATPDYAIVGTDELIEIKSTSVNMYKEWADGNTPGDYVLQAQKQMAVTGAVGVHMVVLVERSEMQSRYVKRDEAVIAQIVETETRFWTDHVLSGIPPKPAENDGGTLERMFPEAREGTVIELDPEAFYLRAEYLAAMQDIKEATARKDVAVNSLKAMMGEFELGTLDGHQVVKWSRVNSDRAERRINIRKA